MKAFIYAARGLLQVVRDERSMRVHLCFVFYVVLAGFVTALTPAEWAAVLLSCALVLAAECVNTSVENVCDTVTKEQRPEIRVAKDAAAGAVLVFSVFSAAAGCVIFFQKPRLILARDFFASHPAAAAAIFALLVPWCLFIFKKRKNR